MNRCSSVFLATVSLLYSVVNLAAGELNDDQPIPRAALLEDIRQLSELIETTHPDPYLRGGGKVAYHRRLQELLELVPGQGMTGTRFAELLLPFVAAIGDSHTGIYLQGSASPLAQSPEMPLLFRLIESSLYVYGVKDPAQGGWIGSRLHSVCSIPVAELLDRQRRVRGIENEVHNLALLGLGLSSRSWLEVLLPEWTDKARLVVGLEKPDAQVSRVAFDISAANEQPPLLADSGIELPSRQGSEVAWRFEGKARDVAILRISGMEGYREAFESYLASGVSELSEFAIAAYQTYQGKPAPDDLDAVVAGLPSASDAFAALVDGMTSAGTRALIVDLRQNTGGNSVMKEILVYFLFGRQGLGRIDDGYQIKKLSSLYLDMYKNDSLQKINADRVLPLRVGDYDFREETIHGDGAGKRQLENRFETLGQLPSFQKWYATGRYHEPQHRLKNVFVLSDPLTYSSGFNLMQSLRDQGAILLGTPSAQSANSFGDSLIATLGHSGVTVFISHKVIVNLSADPTPGHVILPDHPLTWETWAAWDFDPNTEVLMALDLANSGDHKDRRSDLRKR